MALATPEWKVAADVPNFADKGTVTGIVAIQES